MLVPNQFRGVTDPYYLDFTRILTQTVLLPHLCALLSRAPTCVAGLSEVVLSGPSW